MALTAACLLNVVNVLFTLAALKGKHIFSPTGKWSPLSFMKLTHEASVSSSSEHAFGHKEHVFTEFCARVRRYAILFQARKVAFIVLALLRLYFST